MKTTSKVLAAALVVTSLMGSAAYAEDSSQPAQKESAQQMTQSDPSNKPSPLTEEQALQRLHEEKPVYSCGMKPTWFSPEPGQCPCCTMQLEKAKDIKDGKAVFEDGKQSMPMDMKDMDMKGMNDKDMQKMMEKK